MVSLVADLATEARGLVPSILFGRSGGRAATGGGGTSEMRVGGRGGRMGVVGWLGLDRIVRLASGVRGGLGWREQSARPDLVYHPSVGRQSSSRPASSIR
jgi:hypothetical protein